MNTSYRIRPSYKRKEVKRMKKIIYLFSISIVSVLMVAAQAHAHVVVKPAEVGVAERTNFVVGVPTEGEYPTTMVRLLIPESMQSVRPNVKPGWNIELVKAGDGEAARVSEIIWSGGSIPAEQRDEFLFSAQAPAQEGDLQWKAYQTYGDGSIVAWDTNPETVKAHESGAHGSDDKNTPKPFSITKVINDLEVAEEGTSNVASSQLPLSQDMVAGGVLLALIMSGAALYLQLKK